ncbi:hypothetical protein FKX85_09960 [Echinicola soli]|uniref:Uncharacterized protein n=1 Tax=Echinicola soli TaxID=2591634 RepID=A0A514CHN5_9BACT|nr:hypothetical protein [Echinicola soli]QDH79341.1 hypothetical protein FKX85_09960 [Echinicola soli]
MKYQVTKHIKGNEHPVLKYLEEYTYLFNEVDYSDLTRTTEKLFETLQCLTREFFKCNKRLFNGHGKVEFDLNTESDDQFIMISIAEQSIIIKPAS